MHTFHATRSIAFLLLTCTVLIAGCSYAYVPYESREKYPVSQRTDNLQTLIDETPDHQTLRITKGSYIINKGLMIKGRVGLSVIAEPGTMILLTDLDQDVLTIADSKEIRLYNVLLKHVTPLKTYKCHGSVVRIDNAQDITIANSELNGCGAVGISAQKTKNLTIEHCYIHNNTFNALYLSNIQGVNLWSNVIVDNANAMQLYDVSDMQMSDNILERNTGYWRTPIHPAGLLEWSPKYGEAEVMNDK